LFREALIAVTQQLITKESRIVLFRIYCLFKAMITYYTFEGPIISLDDHSGGLAGTGLSTNDNVRYTFLINREMEGKRIDYDGSIYTYDNDRYRVYFFTNLITGSMLKSFHAHESPDDSVVSYNRGFESNRRFDLLSGSKRHYVNVWGASIKDWPNGPTLHGLECMYDNDRNRSVISTKLSLKSISDFYSNTVENESCISNGFIHPEHHY
jgi:hypothetical protein